MPVNPSGPGTLSADKVTKLIDQIEWKATCCYPPQSPVMEYKPFSYFLYFITPSAPKKEPAVEKRVG